MGCGICGFTGMNDSKLLGEMCAVLKHRGPDDEGKFLDDRVGLGSRRLSIIDLKGGKQPISNEDGSIWTVFNGEIYNFVELKNNLESLGHKFKTDSDTEVIVHGFEEWGLKCFESFVGMFALAIWDRPNDRLILARDRFGKKPLFYAMSNGGLLFASEMKAILQHRQINRDIDFRALINYLTFFYIPSPLTIFSSIRKVKPGEFVVFQRRKLTSSYYWDLNFESRTSSHPEDALVEELYGLLEDSVRVRLRSDVPLGAFLSGGIDSSAVVSVMKRLTHSDVSTFSVGFEEGPYDESGWAKKVSEFVGTDHHELTVSPDAAGLIPKLLWHFDEPFADSSLIPTYFVSEATSNHVKVALSGDGGDEIFMGYPWLQDPSVYKYYLAVPSFVRDPLLRAVSRIPVRNDLTTLARHAVDKNYERQEPEERYFLRAAQISPIEVDSLLTDNIKSSLEAGTGKSYLSQYFRRETSGNLLNAIDYVTIKTYLAEDILVKVDRMSMAVSLEVRCPLLDHRLAEFSASLSPDLKIRNSTRKYLLKKMALKKGLLPKDVIFRKKHGFGLPIDYWFKGEWKHLAEQIIERTFSDSGFTSLMRRQHILELMKTPFANASKIFALMFLALWYQMYVECIDNVPSFNIEKYT